MCKSNWLKKDSKMVSRVITNRREEKKMIYQIEYKVGLIERLIFHKWYMDLSHYLYYSVLTISHQIYN